LSQLLLDLNFGEPYTFDSFRAGPNQLVKEVFLQWSKSQGDRFLYLWAPSGHGKSHLLQAASYKLYQAKKSVYYLSLAQPDLTPDILDNLDSFQYICIDDVNCIAQKKVWEEKLFHLYNRLKDNNSFLAVSSVSSPSSIEWSLPDLGSRFSWGMVMRLCDLTDDDKLTALCEKAHERGFNLPQNVAKFLIQHHLRDTKSLFQALDKLDTAALTEKRKLTVPFVKEIMGL